MILGLPGPYKERVAACLCDQALVRRTKECSRNSREVPGRRARKRDQPYWKEPAAFAASCKAGLFAVRRFFRFERRALGQLVFWYWQFLDGPEEPPPSDVPSSPASSCVYRPFSPSSDILDPDELSLLDELSSEPGSL